MPVAPPSTLVGMTPYLLDQLGRSARRDLSARLKNDLGLSLREVWVLAVVDEGDSDVKAVSELLALKRDDVHDLAKDLASRGLLERTGKGGLAATKGGRRALSRAGLAARTVTTSALGALDPQERVQLHGLLARAYAGRQHVDD